MGIPYIWNTCSYIIFGLCRQKATNLDAHQAVFHLAWAHIEVFWSERGAGQLRWGLTLRRYGLATTHHFILTLTRASFIGGKHVMLCMWLCTSVGGTISSLQGLALPSCTQDTTKLSSRRPWRLGYPFWGKSLGWHTLSLMSATLAACSVCAIYSSDWHVFPGSLPVELFYLCPSTSAVLLVPSSLVYYWIWFGCLLCGWQLSFWHCTAILRENQHVSATWLQPAWWWCESDPCCFLLFLLAV